MITKKQKNIGIIIGAIIIIIFSALIINQNNNQKIVITQYACWSNIPNWEFRFESIMPLQYNNTQVSFQKNFIFINKNQSTIYWYQFVFAVNNYNNTKNSTYIGLEKWKSVNNRIVENKFIVYKKVNMNITNLQPIYYNISNNSVIVYFVSYNKSGNQIYKISENIPEGFSLTNKTENESIINNIGFYTNYNYEIDFYNNGLYNTLSQVLFCENLK